MTFGFGFCLVLCGVGFGSGSCTFFTFRFGLGSVLGKTWVLFLFILAGFGFFPSLIIVILYNSSVMHLRTSFVVVSAYRCCSILSNVYGY